MQRTIKEELFDAMQRIASEWPGRRVTLIVCAESETNTRQSMVGYRNESGTGTILYVGATKELIEQIMATAWDATYNGNYGGQSNSQQ